MMTAKTKRFTGGRSGFWPGAVVVLLILSAWFSWTERADHALLDVEFRLLRHYAPHPLEKDVVVVGIDEATFNRFREPSALWHPHLGAFFRAMAQAKPSVLGLDVVLPNRSFQFLAPGYDQMLLQGLLALKASQVPLVLGQSADEHGGPRPIFSPYVALAGDKSQASVLVCTDSDGVVRMAGSLSCNGQEVADTLSGRMAAHSGLGSGQHGLIDYSVGGALNYISFVQVLDWLERGELDKLHATFSGRPVLLGVVTRFDDRVELPVALAVWEPLNKRVPGVLVHAQILRTLMSDGLIREVPLNMVVLICALGGLLWIGHSSWLKLIVVSAMLAGVFGAGTWLLSIGYYLPAASVMTSVLFAATARMALDGWNHAREKRKLKRSFGGYVSPQVMDEILAGRLAWELGGELRRVCILFADVRGFTTLSEAMTPQAVLALLNRYFEEVTRAIHAEGGTINCFMGDGIMATFGAPKHMDNPVVPAFAAARNILKILPVLNRALASDGIAPLSIGIGLNVGDAVVGHIGSHLRHDYSAIGDTINVASRLEGLTKEVGYPLVCSSAVVAELQFPDGFVNLGERQIKGHTPMEVYGWRE